MTRMEIVSAVATVMGIPIVAKLIFTFWRWIRRDAKMKEIGKKIIKLEQHEKIQSQELAQYHDRQTIQEDLEIYRQLVYRSKSTGDTYCIPCWDGTGKLVHAVEKNKGYYCGVCKKMSRPPASGGPFIRRGGRNWVTDGW